MSLISGIHHVSMKACGADEFNRVVEFYKDVLSLPVVRTWETGIMLDTGAGLIEIFNNADEQPEMGVIRHFAFAVEDVDACAAKVTKAGYHVFKGPIDVVIPSNPPFPARIAFCNGPLGEEVEFFQEK